MSVTIDIEKCVGCGLCIEVCAAHALYNQDAKTYFKESKCNQCGMCDRICICSALVFRPETKI